jgi:transcriptional regulator MraZ
LRGSYQAKIDEKGRLKLPSSYRSEIEAEWKTPGVYLTCDDATGKYVRIYPMPVWLELEEKLARVPSIHPARLKYLDRSNYFGQSAELDAQGRVLIPVRLRESATMVGEVDVLGQYNYLDVWNHDRFVAKMQREPLTDDDLKALAEFDI